MWFQTEQPGLFVGQCAEFCGTQHANMLLRVVVDPPEDFERWLGNMKTSASGRRSAAVVTARRRFSAQIVRQLPSRARHAGPGTYAPDLTHLMSRQTLAAGMVPNTPENLRRWVDDPQQIKPGCLMPAFGLSERDRDSDRRLSRRRSAEHSIRQGAVNMAVVER